MTARIEQLEIKEKEVNDFIESTKMKDYDTDG